MNFKKFIRDKIIYIVLMLFAIVTSEILLIPFDIHLYIKLYIGIIPIIFYCISFFIEYFNKKKFYDSVKNKIIDLNDKYLISEIIETANFEEGRILKEVLQEAGKSMLENVNKYKYLQEEYKEYIELWIHEIKLPISAGKLVIENNKSDVTASINEELDKIENYVEQALFYARSQLPEKDYIIKKQNLKEIINTVILKNKTLIRQSKIKLDVYNIDKIVYIDSKWCVFIINQILQNSIKYSKSEDKTIEIFGVDNKENTILYIKDNGIGIRKGEITRVFEKGFTGENGRRNGQKATGIGLYLCKKLCDKIGLGIVLNSEENIGTEVRLVFPKNSLLTDTIN